MKANMAKSDSDTKSKGPKRVSLPPGFIDLGREEPDYGSPVMAAEPDPDRPKRINYPTLYLSDVKDLELGEEGEMLIKFKVVEAHISSRNEPSNRYEIEIYGIKPTTTSKADEDEIDKGLDEAAKEIEESDEDE